MCNFYVQSMLYLGVCPQKKLNLLAILAKSLLKMYHFNECSIRITHCSIRVYRSLKARA